MLRNRRAVLQNPFSPLDISGLKCWIDFSDKDYLFTDAGTTRVSADADAIYQANDKSGNGTNAVQATADKRPLYKVGILNNLSTAKADGSNDSMAVGDITLSDYSVFVAFKYATSASSTDTVFAWDNYNTSPRQALISYANRGAVGQSHQAYIAGTGELKDTNVPLVNTTPYLFDFIRKNTGIAVNKNGVALTGIVVGSGAFTTVGHRLFTHYYSGADQAQWSASYIGEYLIYDSALPETDAARVRSYLRQKWNLYA